MDTANLTVTLLSCAFFMALVAWISYRKTRGDVSTQDGYFLAGRGLGATFIAGSLLLTNLSAEQLVGLNGSAYGFNLSSMAWEVTAAFATICMAFIFLPRYLAGAGRLSGVLIHAWRHMGADQIDDAHITWLCQQIPAVSRHTLQADEALAPAWMHARLRQLYEV